MQTINPEVTSNEVTPFVNIIDNEITVESTENVEETESPEIPDNFEVEVQAIQFYDTSEQNWIDSVEPSTKLVGEVFYTSEEELSKNKKYEIGQHGGKVSFLKVYSILQEKFVYVHRALYQRVPVKA